MKVYIARDVNISWRIQISKPKWKNNDFGWDTGIDSTSVCRDTAEKIVTALGFDHTTFTPGDYLEADLT